MSGLDHLLAKNRAWAAAIRASDPNFFCRLTHQQAPQYFWIGCSDSRVPANQIVDLLPGEMFVHRNVANLVASNDLNCLSALQFAVDVLKVRHVIVCGHYGCAGIRAVLCNQRLGLVDTWLLSLKCICNKHQAQLDSLPGISEKTNRLCELNVREQVANLCAAEIVQQAWKRGQQLTVHGWIYAVSDGLLHALEVQTGQM
jgi:carbonic anhydrase